MYYKIIIAKNSSRSDVLNLFEWIDNFLKTKRNKDNPIELKISVWSKHINSEDIDYKEENEFFIEDLENCDIFEELKKDMYNIIKMNENETKSFLSEYEKEKNLFAIFGNPEGIRKVRIQR